jgi:uncharacterized membrane protein
MSIAIITSPIAALSIRVGRLWLALAPRNLHAQGAGADVDASSRSDGAADARASLGYGQAMTRAAPFEDMAPAERGRASELAPVPAEGASEFDAVLYPNRSLPNVGFLIVMGIVVGANIVFGGYFYAIGAWPVIGFCGLDIFLVWLAFKLSYRQGRLHERVRVVPGDMRVARVLPSGHETRWRLEPYWARVVIDNPDTHDSCVRVVSGGRSLVLGAFLSPGERMNFAAALKAALTRAAGQARGQS